MGRRKPLQPLPADLPEPVRVFTEELRSLHERIGLTLGALGKELSVSDSSLSRYLNARTRVPADVLVRLCELAGVSPAERDRLLAARETPPAVRVEAAPPADEPRPVRTRPLGRTALLAALTSATGGLVFAAVLPAMSVAPGEARDQVSCARRPQYRVSARGNVLDAAGNVVGMVWKNDVFTRDDSVHPSMRYRYYGTVKHGPSGYVMQEKLDYYRSVCR